MIKTFKHLFQNGKTIQIKVDMSKSLPTIEGGNNEMVDQESEVRYEFEQWVQHSVIPIIMDIATDEQVRNFAKYARKKQLI